MPIAGDAGYHHDDWEGVQIRIRPDGSGRRARLLPQRLQLRRRAPPTGARTPVSARSGTLAEALGARADERLGPGDPPACSSPAAATPATPPAISDIDRFTPGRRVHLIPLEPIAADSHARFAINPPWRKHVWRDPEAEGTD